MFIVVGVTAGIAAYKSVQLVRSLVLEGHEVHVVPTDDALRFVGRATWEAISRNTVTTSVHDDVPTVRHVALGQSADLVIVAPATADFLAKQVAGLAGDLLGTTLLATTAPVVVAPAMHTEMWHHPATQHNVRVLRERGVHVVGPADGALTGDDSGPGRMSDPDEIIAAAVAIADAPGDLSGLRIVVSTGGTREPIDPVRFLGNRSSGRQGVAVAVAAAARGANVHLVAAHVDTDALVTAVAHPRVHVTRVGTAAELAAAVTSAARDADVVVMAAAVADYRAATVSDGKLTKDDAPAGTLSLDLIENPDILARLVAARPPGQTIVGFAAETESDPAALLARGREKRRRKGVDLLAVNEVGWSRGFESADNTVHLIDAADDLVGEISSTKRAAADMLWDAVVAARSRA